MPLTFLLDEHLRGTLWRALQRHNAGGLEPLDVIRVGDAPDLPLGTLDPEILIWAERAGRILISRDASTLSGHLADHMQAGDHSPGIFMVRRRCLLAQVVAFLVEAAYRSDATDWENRIEYIP
jgi:Domain of unknown function (DUF5615)